MIEVFINSNILNNLNDHNYRRSYYDLGLAFLGAGIVGAEVVSLYQKKIDPFLS